jgi:hypothetical protein
LFLSGLSFFNLYDTRVGMARVTPAPALHRRGWSHELRIELSRRRGFPLQSIE